MANETLFSEGVASYFYDIMAPLFEEDYAKEARASFEAFGGGPSTEVNVHESDFIEKAKFIENIKANW